MMPELSQQQTAKLVLLGEMGSGKSSLVLRYVKGQFFDYQVGVVWCVGPSGSSSFRHQASTPLTESCCAQASTVGAAFLVKTIPELNVKFEIWSVVVSWSSLALTFLFTSRRASVHTSHSCMQGHSGPGAVPQLGSYVLQVRGVGAQSSSLLPTLPVGPFLAQHDGCGVQGCVCCHHGLRHHKRRLFCSLQSVGQGAAEARQP